MYQPRRLAASFGLASGCAGRNWLFCVRRSGAVDDVEVVALDLETRSPKLARLEAAMLVAGKPTSARKLAQFAALADVREVKELVEQLNNSYGRTRSTFRVERVAAGYQLLTQPLLANWLDRLHHRQSHLKLSPPMMETLAIVAYRQPATRADIEAVRGVQSAEMLKQLMERSLVKIVGEDDSLGRPYLYGTTRQFLELYGLTSLHDLPMSDTLRRVTVAAANADPADVDTTDAEIASGEDQTADEAA
ncbi:MAG: SMC-Scp complex subunit ScpB [Planctomycetaceae bacterium]